MPCKSCSVFLRIAVITLDSAGCLQKTGKDKDKYPAKSQVWDMLSALTAHLTTEVREALEIARGSILGVLSNARPKSMQAPSVLRLTKLFFFTLLLQFPDIKFQVWQKANGQRKAVLFNPYICNSCLFFFFLILPSLLWYALSPLCCWKNVLEAKI